MKRTQMISRRSFLKAAAAAAAACSALALTGCGVCFLGVLRRCRFRRGVRHRVQGGRGSTMWTTLP